MMSDEIHQTVAVTARAPSARLGPIAFVPGPYQLTLSSDAAHLYPTLSPDPRLAVTSVAPVVLEVARRDAQGRAALSGIRSSAITPPNHDSG
jgi:hypothetical protein